MSGVSRTGDAQYIESVITSGSVLAVTSGGEPSGSAHMAYLDPVQAAVTEEGEFDTESVEVGTSDAEMFKLKLVREMQMKRSCLVRYQLLNRTRKTEVKGNLTVNRSCYGVYKNKCCD